MKALTLWQPWASLVVHGAKPYEFRGWKPPASVIGQRIVIHASARKIARGQVEDLWDALGSDDINDVAATCLLVPFARDVLGLADRPGGLPLGAGIGTAVVGVPRHGGDIAAEFGVRFVNDSDRNEHANWGWPMLDVKLWEHPVPMAGNQGLWNWPEATGGGSCRVEHCSLDANPGQLMCRAHWFSLPKPLRDAIWDTCGSDRRAYATNVRTALDLIGGGA